LVVTALTVGWSIALLPIGSLIVPRWCIGAWIVALLRIAPLIITPLAIGAGIIRWLTVAVLRISPALLSIGRRVIAALWLAIPSLRLSIRALLTVAILRLRLPITAVAIILLAPVLWRGGLVPPLRLGTASVEPCQQGWVHQIRSGKLRLSHTCWRRRVAAISPIGLRLRCRLYGRKIRDAPAALCWPHWCAPLGLSSSGGIGRTIHLL